MVFVCFYLGYYESEVIVLENLENVSKINMEQETDIGEWYIQYVILLEQIIVWLEYYVLVRMWEGFSGLWENNRQRWRICGSKIYYLDRKKRFRRELFQGRGELISELF